MTSVVFGEDAPATEPDITLPPNDACTAGRAACVGVAAVTAVVVAVSAMGARISEVT